MGLCLQRGNFSGRRRLVHHSYLDDRRGESLFRMFFYRVQRRRQASGRRNHPVLQIRKEGVSHPREIIPIRVLEIGEVNTAFEWASTAIKKQLTKDFTASESDIDSIQQVMDSGRFQTQQRMAWENFGIAFGAILVNEMEGMEWVTVIEGQKEYPALQFMCSDMVLDPAALVWGKAKKGLPCDLKSEFRKIKREAEAVLDDLNK